MPNYSDFLNDYSSVVSEYQMVYTKELAQAETLQRKLQTIFEQSGFSKLHRIVSSDAFVEYQKQLVYLSKVFDAFKHSGALLSSANLAKTTMITESLLKKQIPYTSMKPSVVENANNVTTDNEKSPDIQSNSSTHSAQTHNSSMEETAIIPAVIGKWFTTSLLQKLLYDDFVAGESSASEEYIKAIAEIHGWATTMNWLNTVYLDNYSNSEVLIGLMHCLSHFCFEDVKPAGPTMALGVLQHEDIFVRDYAIRAFENWDDKEAVPILKSLSCEAEWLQDYVNKVIVSLEG